MRRLLLCTLFAIVAAAMSAVGSTTASEPPAPLADHHQHLFSPGIAALLSTTTIDAAELVALLDAAGVQRAVVLSVAYMYGRPSSTFEDEYGKVKAENDWTSQQVARFPARLRGFCSVNPVKDYALDELARCAKDPHLRHGLKLHLANSKIDYENPQHIERVRAVFRAANRHRMAIVAHIRASQTDYGRDEARLFLHEIVPEAPDVPIQIAHLAGWGSFDAVTDQAISVFVDAIEKNDPRMKQIYFDITSVVLPDTTTENLNQIATRIRQLGTRRMLFGSDAAVRRNLAPRENWATFRTLPLTDDEFRTIAANVPPYMR